MSKQTNQNAVLAAIESNRHLDGALLPVLHQVQRALGHIPKDSVGAIAKGLNLSRAEVHGAISFYHSFTTVAHGKHRIEICRAESCQAVGGREIESAVKNALGIDFDETTADGEITLEPVYCLGNCGCSPAVKIDTQIYGRVSSESVLTLIENLRSTGKSGAQS
ncbi:MAG: formate dehydrogenase subunit gamma [Gammaproteobacteria bacterium]|nr:formate dehydrogenase subunit gamma [Gammaproteobacteria bacterium]